MPKVTEQPAKKQETIFGRPALVRWFTELVAGQAAGRFG